MKIENKTVKNFLVVVIIDNTRGEKLLDDDDYTIQYLMQ